MEKGPACTCATFHPSRSLLTCAGSSSPPTGRGMESGFPHARSSRRTGSGRRVGLVQVYDPSILPGSTFLPRPVLPSLDDPFFFFHPSSSSSSSTLALFLERKDAMLANREEESRRKIEKNFGVFIFFFFVQLFFIVLLYLVIFSLEKMFEGTFLVIGGRKISIFLELEKIFIF